MRVFYPVSFYYTSNAFVGKVAKERNETIRKQFVERPAVIARKERFFYLCQKYGLVTDEDKEDLQQAVNRLALGKFSTVPYTSLRSDRDNRYYYKVKNRYKAERERAREVTECKHIFFTINKNVCA